MTSVCGAELLLKSFKEGRFPTDSAWSKWSRREKSNKLCSNRPTWHWSRGLIGQKDGRAGGLEWSWSIKEFSRRYFCDSLEKIKAGEEPFMKTFAVGETFANHWPTWVQFWLICWFWFRITPHFGNSMHWHIKRLLNKIKLPSSQSDQWRLKNISLITESNYWKHYIYE